MVDRISRPALVFGVTASLFSASPVFAATASPGTFGNPVGTLSFASGDKCSLFYGSFGSARTCSSLELGSADGFFGNAPTLSGGNPEQSGGATSISGSVGGISVSAAADAEADYGSLHAYGEAQFHPYDDGSFAHAYGFASFIDEVTVTSTSYVTVTFTSILEGAVLNEAIGGSVLRVADADGLGGELDIVQEMNEFGSYGIPSEYVQLAPGHTYVIFDELTAEANASSNFAHNDSYEQVADFSDTGLLYIDAPAGTLSFLSGHDYSTTTSVGGVPEPSTWAMLLMGFLGLGFAARRRAARLSAGT